MRQRVELGDFHQRSACTGATGCQIPDKSPEGKGRRRDVSKVAVRSVVPIGPKNSARKYSERAARNGEVTSTTAPSGVVPRSTQWRSASSAQRWRSREKEAAPGARRHGFILDGHSTPDRSHLRCSNIAVRINVLVDAKVSLSWKWRPTTDWDKSQRSAAWRPA